MFVPVSISSLYHVPHPVFVKPDELDYACDASNICLFVLLVYIFTDSDADGIYL